jgi:hypothetical protein
LRLNGEKQKVRREKAMTLRHVAYLFALAAIAITVPFAAAPGRHTIAIALLGGTLAATPYVVVRALEEVRRESGPTPRN